MAVNTTFSGYSALTSTPTACPSCFFGAIAATLLSFPYDIVETITVTTIPYTSTCDDGDIITSTATITGTPTITLSSSASTFAVDHYTWDVSGVSMAYPSTYIQYLDFERDDFYPTATEDTTCAGSTITTAPALPSPTNPSAFIYPITDPIWTTTENHTLFFSVPLPTTLGLYLETLAQQEACATGFSNVLGCRALQTSWTNSPGPRCATTYYTSTDIATDTASGSVPAALATPAVPVYGPPPLYNETATPLPGRPAVVVVTSYSTSYTTATVVNCTDVPIPTPLAAAAGGGLKTASSRVFIPGTETATPAYGIVSTLLTPREAPTAL
ncbi:Hypothetical predicted protein [Lecanosticta acicola]|uniref:Uncharacterized protein n=1 Tax=Lecanosticta acicola TaxID=111012 RepID=A0AAI8YU19_9PEZI|nr:Hypothetical predicted protein [Lecanosticta acicola]